MGNEVMAASQQTAVGMPSADFKAIAVEWLRSTGNLQKFTANEQNQFVDMCTAFGLNPIKREIYGVKYGNNFNLIVGYETYIKRAERSGKLAGWKAWVEGTGTDLVAKIEIHRKDWDFPLEHEVYFDEYKQDTAIWKSKPRTMIRKVVIAQGFRMAFSDDLGGMPYTADELPTEKIIGAEVEVKPQAKPAPAKQKKGTLAQQAMEDWGLKLEELLEAYRDKLPQDAVAQIEAVLDNGTIEDQKAEVERCHAFLVRSGVIQG